MLSMRKHLPGQGPSENGARRQRVREQYADELFDAESRHLSLLRVQRRTRAPLAQAAARVPGDAAICRAADFTPPLRLAAIRRWICDGALCDWAHACGVRRTIALQSVAAWIARGGADLLFRDGPIARFIKRMTDCIE